MNIVVFGSTGGTGSEVVKQALAAGHDVTAVTRNIASATLRHARLTVIGGDVLEPDSVANAVKNQDVVVFAIGAPDRAPTTIYSQGILNVLSAMKTAKVNRILCVSAGGLDPSGLIQTFVAKAILWRVFKNGYTDMAQMETNLRASDVNWTILRPPRLTYGPRTGSYRVAVNSRLGGWLLSRADLADYMVTHLDAPTHQAIVEIAY